MADQNASPRRPWPGYCRFSYRDDSDGTILRCRRGVNVKSLTSGGMCWSAFSPCGRTLLSGSRKCALREEIPVHSRALKVISTALVVLLCVGCGSADNGDLWGAGALVETEWSDAGVSVWEPMPAPLETLAAGTASAVTPPVAPVTPQTTAIPPVPVPTVSAQTQPLQPEPQPEPTPAPTAGQVPPAPQLDLAPLGSCPWADRLSCISGICRDTGAGQYFKTGTEACVPGGCPIYTTVDGKWLQECGYEDRCVVRCD